MTAAIADIRTDRARLLRLALRVDALASGALGVMFAAGAGALDGPLGVGAAQLVGFGLALVGWAAALLVVAGRPRPHPVAVWTIVGLNAVTALDSLILAAGDWLTPTALGSAVLVAQAVAVTGFAFAQYLGLRRAA